MAVNNSTTKITIPVEFRDTANSYKTIINDLQAQLQKVKPGTSIYNSLVKQFERAKKAAEKLELDIDLGVSKRSDIDKLENEFSTVHSLIQGIQRSFENIDLKDLNIHPENFGELATQYADARKELIRLKEEAKKAKDITVGELFKDSSDAALFNKSQMSSKGVTVFENLNQEIAQISTNLANAQKDVKALEAALARLQAKQATKGEPTEAGKKAQLYYGITGNASTTVKQSRENLKAAIRENFKEDGTLKAGGKAKVEEILTQFGLDPELLKQGTKERLALIEKAIDEEVNGKKFDEVRKTYSESAQTNRAAVELQQKITDTTQALDRAKHEVETQGETGKLGELRKQVESLRQKLIDSGAIGRDGQKTSIEEQIDAVNERLEQLEQQIRANGPGGGNNNPPGSEPPSMGGVREAYEAQQDAAQFTQELKQSISRWMSAAQVINLVKDGIRQAYQDIKGLDTAMTNIAVVTDMSVSDLWGKINEYMSIAQQYGVTTQGVYEVSQLYYQQGLSTNEVMAATTETLKMARIAGMDYAEAADAMTVAIRAFKMEMSDASHVTDVYSKVAAVTASDTEELAIAMSKTASSAESVGSSFENTTAMLAVMVETTRESAQNLGSALKSIISRYGEMKVGSVVDADGEIIAINKVDEALSSIGISLKDSNNQIRDFDEVIFELSAKWDTLDKNTQRYIATIMAGNRQQSRFIALVDNWERLEEVAGAAQDSEDAGLLQYAKTLDSLDTKLNNIKTSFQEFYMNIINGPLISGALDAINRLIQGFNKLGSAMGILNLIGIIRGLKTGLKLLVNTFGNSFTNIISSWKNTQAEWLTLAMQSGYERGYKEGQQYARGVKDGQTGVSFNGPGGRILTDEDYNWAKTLSRKERKELGIGRNYVNMTDAERFGAYNSMNFWERRQKGLQTGKTGWKNNSWNGSGWGQGISIGGALLGSALQMAGSTVAQDNARAGSVLSGFGNIAQGASMGAMLGPWGAVIGGVIGGLASLPSVLEAFDPANVLKEKLAKAEEALKEAELERAQKKETARDLESTIENLKKLQAARYDSEEANKAFIDASNEAAQKFPQLVSGYTATGDAIVDVINEVTRSEQALIQARKDAAKTALEASKQEYIRNATEVEQAENTATEFLGNIDDFDSHVAGIVGSNQYSNFFKDNEYGSFAQLLFTDEKVILGGSTREDYSLDEYGIKYQSDASSINYGVMRNALVPVLDGGRSFYETPITNAEITELFSLGAEGIPTLEELNAMPRTEQLVWYAKFLQGAPEEKFQTVLGINEIAARNYRNNLIAGLEWDARQYDLIDEDYTDLISLPTIEAKEATTQQKKTVLEDSTQRMMSQQVYSLAIGDDPLMQSSWYKTDSVLDFTTEYLMNQLGISADDFTYDEETQQLSFINIATEEQFNQRARELKDQFDLLTDTQIESLNRIIQQINSGDISIEDAESQLTEILGVGNPLVELYASNFQTMLNTRRTRLFQSVNFPQNEEFGATIGQEQFAQLQSVSDYDSWLIKEGRLDTAESRSFYNAYVQDELAKIRQTAEEQQDYLMLFLIDAPIKQVSEYQKAITEEIEYINNNPSGFGVNSAQKRLQKISEWAIEIGKGEQGIFAGVGDEGMAEFYRLLNTDRGTYEWADNLEAWGVEYGVNLGDLEELAFEIYEIRLQRIIDTTKESINSLKSLQEKQSKGFTWDEANNLLEQIKQFNPKATFDSLFAIGEDGIITLKDFGQTADILYQKTLHDLSEQKRHLNEDIISEINNGFDPKKSYWLMADFDEETDGTQSGLDNYLKSIQKTLSSTALTLEGKTSAAEEAATKISQAYGLNLTDDELMSLAQAILDGKIQSEQDIIDFYTNLHDSASNAYDVFSRQNHDMIASLSFDNWAEGFTNASTAKTLTAGGTVSNLKDIWKQGADKWNETVTEGQITWTETAIKALTAEQVAAMGGLPEVGTLKDSQYWTSADYADYYKAQANALYTHGASLDAFGNLIITDWERWGEYIASSYKDIDSKAYQSIMAEANAEAIRARENYVSSIVEGFSALAEGLAKDGDIEFSKLDGIITTLQQKGIIDGGTYQLIINKYNEAKEQGVEGLKNFLIYLSGFAAKGGIQIDLSEVKDLYQDTLTEITKSIFDNIQNAIEGTISQANLSSLAQQLEIPDLNTYGIQTIKGFQLNAEGLLKVLAAAEKKYGNIYGTTQKMTELFVGEDKLYKGYEDLDEVIEELEKKGKNITDEERKQLTLLKEMRAVAFQMANDPAYNFMDYDSTNGNRDAWDNFISDAREARDVLKTLGEGGVVDIHKIDNMMNFMGRQLGAEGALSAFGYGKDSYGSLIKSINTFGATIDTTNADEVYAAFVRNIIASHNGLGEIDATILMKLGINVEEAAKGMEDGLKQFAKKQVEYWKQIRDMLVKMEELEDISAELKMDIRFVFGGKEGYASVPEMIEAFFNRPNDNTIVINGETYNVDASEVLETIYGRLYETFSKRTESDSILGLFTGEEFLRIFFGDNGQIDETEFDNLRLFQNFDFDAFTEEQLRYISQKMVAATTGLTPDDIHYEEAILKVIKEILTDGIDNLPDVIGQEEYNTLAEKLQGMIDSGSEQTAFTLSWGKDGVNVKLSFDEKAGFKVTVGEGGDLEDDEFRAALSQAYREKLRDTIGEGRDILIDSNGLLTVVITNPEITAKLGTNSENVKVTDFDGTTYSGTIEAGDGTIFTYKAAADGTSIVLADENGNPLTTEDQQKAGQQALADQGLDVIELSGANGTVTYALTSQFTGDGVTDLTAIRQTVENLYALFNEGQVLKLAMDNSSIDLAKASLEAIVTAWQTLKDLESQGPIILTVNQGGNVKGGANEQATNNGPGASTSVGLVLDTAGFVSELITFYEKIKTNTTEAGTPIATIAAEWTNLDGWKQESLKQTISVNYSGLKRTNADLPRLTQHIDIVEHRNNGNGGGSNSEETSDTPGEVKGNVALAKGNCSALMAGAAFAQGTLMGELGPELYVQGGQYHIAGANGPEFVDLDRDAIVFNHLQTANLLGKGHSTTTGLPVTSERRSVGAYATGNVSGFAMASGVSQAIKAVDNIIAYWQGIANLPLGSLLDSASGGGGGSGESLTAVTGELQEWYNLTRQIENLEQKINNLIAERENIRGGAALRNLRTQQALLEKQAATQSTLLKYQQMQLERQKEHILNNDIWGKFLTFDNDGNLQYINGNEANGGKGALDVLQNFHKMSGEEQQAYLAKIGYSYTDQDGKTYEGTKLAEKFEEEFQAQIDQYQSLYDTVNETEATLENIKSEINEIEEEIRENQIELEQDIYDILVEAWEEQIDHMEDQKELIEDANKAYIKGLNNALSTEQNMYQDNQSVEEREQLQRRLALLRRSGGSASKIYDLEQQLDKMLKDEYFNEQKEMIENIEKANDEQVEKLKQQIKLQEEALEYQKENGVLWTKVYEIMAGTTEDILAFMQGNSVDFFEQSALSQKQVLEEWWNSIDMFTTDREYLNHKEAFQNSNWDTGKVWESSELSGLKSIFDGLGDEEKDLLKATYLDAYASSRANGGTEEEAAKSAIDSLKNQLEARKNQQNNEGNEAPTTQPGTSSSSEGAANGKKYRVEYRYFMYKSQEDKKNNSSDRKKVTGSGVGTTAKQAQQNATYWVNKGNSTKQAAISAGYTVLGNLKYYEAKQFLKGGLVDYTGPAIVHGSKSKPEAFLNAKQTAMISDAVKIVGDGGALDGIKAVLNKLDTSIKNLVANNTKEINNFTVAPGAVTIQVAQLNDSYDVEELSKDIMNRMVSIASKTTNRGVNRR